MTKQEIQERIRKILYKRYLNAVMRVGSPDQEALEDILSLISDVVDEVIGEKELLWETDLIKQTIRNSLRQEQQTKRKELLG